MTRILILGGTMEAAALAGKLECWPGLDVITSLAGRTRSPDRLPGKMRIGGFDGPEGLASYLRHQAVDALIDATHPFAAQMSRHAVLAAERAAVPRLRLLRPPWEKRAGDHWIEAADAAQAAEILPALARRVFLAAGHRALAAFAGLDGIWFLIRTIEPTEGPLPRRVVCLNAKGPFDEAAEIALLKRHRIDALVTKASGGEATYPKIAAARKLGLPVVMIRCPPPPPGPIVHDTEAALAWLRQAIPN